jgi:hypothetical protein
MAGWRRRHSNDNRELCQSRVNLNADHWKHHVLDDNCDFFTASKCNSNNDININTVVHHNVHDYGNVISALRHHDRDSFSDVNHDNCDNYYDNNQYDPDYHNNRNLDNYYHNNRLEHINNNIN